MKNRRAAAKYPKLLRRQQASQYLLEVHGLRFAWTTLAKFSCRGVGPEVVYVNDIPFYRPAGLDVWARATISKPTTQARKYPQPRGRRRLKPKQESPNTEPPVVAA